ncbi:MAG: AAA family ATPase, partial [Lachnospiraceae bacterium]|nr:AAA family ATPase [Lachnospiraceae bacterium]
MARTVGIGIQDFAKMITNDCFYVDKTDFIREWWESKDDVTLITRPRRFGKTLNMSMLEQFFSVDYAGRGELFQGLSVWKNEAYRELQGTYPVISLSFARVKEVNYRDTREKICEIIRNLYIKYDFLKESPVLTDADRAYYNRILEPEIGNSDATSALYQLSDYLYRYYGRKVIILLDEYDTPMQEAFVGGYWEEMVSFTRSLFNSTFKTNPWLERAVMTGITRISKESIFSDLNNLKVVTTTSDEYATSFGFTEEEVFAALEECGLSEKKEEVKNWYDGFIFGEYRYIYNPWSILNFLDTGKLGTYWANTSSNSLAGKLIREGSRSVKEKFEILLRGGSIQSPIDEQIVYNQLRGNESAVWSLLLASGYLKVLSYEDYFEIPEDAQPKYELMLTNREVKLMFQNMIRDWFKEAETDYNDFIKALLLDDLDAMNEYMNRVALRTFSYFDTGNNPSGAEPERFYHGFVLGLLVDLRDRYVITSNRESGFGRYDVVLEPRNSEKDAITNNRCEYAITNNCYGDAIIIEFKVRNQR